MRASYRHGIAWIAENDNDGDEEALDVEVVSGMVSVSLLADLFGKDQEDVAKAVVRYRRKVRKVRQGRLATRESG